MIFSPETETILNDSKAMDLAKPNNRRGFEITKDV